MDRLSLRGATVEIRNVDDPVASRKLGGYAALWDTPSQPISGGDSDDDNPPFIEVIRRGAFARAINQGQDVRALWNHDSSLVLGRTSNGTLTLNEDERGLAFLATPPDTQWARDLLTLVARGDVSQCSFCFSFVADRWATSNGAYTRELLDVDLYDVGPVTFPAYTATSVAVRSVRVPNHLTRPFDGRKSLSRARARLRIATIQEKP